MSGRGTHVGLDGDDQGSQRDEDARLLYRFARERGDTGFIYEDVAARFHWEYTYFIKIVKRVRLLLGESNETLNCDPQGMGERWKYYLTNDPEAVKRHHVNRLLDQESRIETMGAMMRSIVNATDPRSAPGLLARLVEEEIAHVGVLIEKLRASLDGPATGMG